VLPINQKYAVISTFTLDKVRGLDTEEIPTGTQNIPHGDDPKKRRIILLKLLAFRSVKGDRCHCDMSIAVAYKLQHVQLQALFDKKLARKKLREVKQKHSAPCPVSNTSRTPRDFFCPRQAQTTETISSLLNPVRTKLEELGLCVSSFLVVCRRCIILATSSTSLGSRRSMPVSSTPPPTSCCDASSGKTTAATRA
jgi:hypothetical protein